VDVTGIEPATPCLQSRAGKTLKALSGVAYTENQRNFRSSVVPKLSRISAPLLLLSPDDKQAVFPAEVGGSGDQIRLKISA
jgi:hypothetical protein